ncbi:hypothetical protein QTP86_012074 [Hemibagrus guttatus]|nr:hypothetical protein QTP86_012074 [Hemibagrus guttatus]
MSPHFSSLEEGTGSIWLPPSRPLGSSQHQRDKDRRSVRSFVSGRRLARVLGGGHCSALLLGGGRRSALLLDCGRRSAPPLGCGRRMGPFGLAGGSRAPPTYTTASAWISACLVDISSWMKAHQLKLNPSKTELLVIPGDPSPAHDLALSLNKSMISPSATACNLGVTMDNQLSFSSHVANVTRSFYTSIAGTLRRATAITEDEVSHFSNSAWFILLTTCDERKAYFLAHWLYKTYIKHIKHNAWSWLSLELYFLLSLVCYSWAGIHRLKDVYYSYTVS